jgi:hypothetical protein
MRAARTARAPCAATGTARARPAGAARPLRPARRHRTRGLPAGWLPRRRPRRPPELEEAPMFLYFFNFGEILVQHFLKNTEMLRNIFVYLFEKCWVNIFKELRKVIVSTFQRKC